MCLTACYYTCAIFGQLYWGCLITHHKSVWRVDGNEGADDYLSTYNSCCCHQPLLTVTWADENPAHRCVSAFKGCRDHYPTTMKCALVSKHTHTTVPLPTVSKRLPFLAFVDEKKGATCRQTNKKIRSYNSDSNRTENSDPRLISPLPAFRFTVEVPILPGSRAHFLQAARPRLVEDSRHGD